MHYRFDIGLPCRNAIIPICFALTVLIVVICSPLNVPANGEINYNKAPVADGGYPLDTVASFSCDYGYSRSGSSSRTCETSGNWNHQNPTCNQSKLYEYDFCISFITVSSSHFII